MHISFDLDGTLIPLQHTFETEKRNIPARLLGVEPLRPGTVNLFGRLQEQGHSLHIYTTSYRSVLKIRMMLWCYGIVINRIVTQPANERKLKSVSVSASKYPPAFGFDIHIDDSPGVALEG